MRKIVIALDDSACALTATKWALDTLATRPDDEIHLLAVQALITAGMAPAAPLATAGSVAALTANYQQALRDEEVRVKSLLLHVRDTLLKRPDLHCHALPAAGGASGVGESIVTWVKKERADVVVVGSRGMGATKSTLMSVVGLGSVSSYCLHHSTTTAVAVVHGSCKEWGEKKASKKVLVAVDDSECAKFAQKWAIEHVLGPQDQLHLISTALPVPYVAGVQASVLSSTATATATGTTRAATTNLPVAGDFEAEYRGAMEHAKETTLHAVHTAFSDHKIAADDAAAAHVLEAEEEEEAEKGSNELARDIVDAAVEDAIKHGKVDKKRLYYAALEPEGGASDVGLSIKHYAEANDVGVVVVGSRGMGAMKRALLSFVGLGSVSDWLASNMSHCPVIVVKGGGEKEQ